MCSCVFLRVVSWHALLTQATDWQIDGELQPVDWEDALVATAKTLRAAGEKTAVVAGGLADAEVTYAFVRGFRGTTVTWYGSLCVQTSCLRQVPFTSRRLRKIR